MVAVSVRALTKVFDPDVVAVDDVSLEIPSGEFLVLFGPVGSGKTTLLRLIGGIERPTSGEVLIGGTPVAELPERDRTIALVFQSYSIYPHLTVAQNIDFPLRAGAEPPGRRRAGRRGGPASGHHRPARPPAVAPLPWATAAGGDGPGHRPAPGAAAARRSAVQRGPEDLG